MTAKTEKTEKKGEKFSIKWGVDEYKGVYQDKTGTLAMIHTAPPGHPFHDPTSPTTFDPIAVEEMDKGKRMTTPIEVWTDKDSGKLWIVDGRSTKLNVEEVNRRRAAEKPARDPLVPLLVPFYGDEKDVIARIAIKNFHRRAPTPSAMAIYVQKMRKAGHSWEACAAAVHVQSADPEQFCRKLLPLAYCVPEVQRAIDDGLLSKTAAKNFGGTHPEGEGAKSRTKQLELLAEALEEKETRPTPKTVGAASQAKVLKVFSNGAKEKLSKTDSAVADVVAATLARIAGNTKALREWPHVSALFDEALAKPYKSPKKTEEK